MFEWKVTPKDHDIYVTYRGRLLKLMRGGKTSTEPQEKVIHFFDNVRSVLIVVGSRTIADIHDASGLLDIPSPVGTASNAAASDMFDMRSLPPNITILGVIRLAVASTPEGVEKFDTLPKLATVHVNPDLKTTGEAIGRLEHPDLYKIIDEASRKD